MESDNKDSPEIHCALNLKILNANEKGMTDAERHWIIEKNF